MHEVLMTLQENRQLLKCQYTHLTSMQQFVILGSQTENLIFRDDSFIAD
jgi:hypothetical protein